MAHLSVETARRSVTMADGKRGVVIVGHGTREAAGIAQFRQLVERIESRLPGVIVEPAFIELAEPGITEGIGRVVARGAATVAVSPLLLYAAGHAKRDIPACVEDARRRHPSVNIEQCRVLGDAPPVVALARRRWQEALSQPAARPAAESVLLSVGRGSGDAEAIAEFKRQAADRFTLFAAARLELAFLAMAKPTLDDALERCAAGAETQIVVQPHLLFPGELTKLIEGKVCGAQQRWPRKRWMVAGPLGVDDLLVQAALIRLNIPRSAVK